MGRIPHVGNHSMPSPGLQAGPARGGFSGYIVPGPRPRGPGSRGPEEFRFPR